MNTMKEFIRQQFHESAAVKILTAELIGESIAHAAAVIIAALRERRTVFVCGNGGSAADAQHFAAELVGRYKRERAALPVHALTTDTSSLTALGNDYDFSVIFKRQLEAFAHEGDVLVVLSTSGMSENVHAAAEYARTRQMSIIALTGRGGGVLRDIADVAVIVPSEATERIQETHETIYHTIAALVEQALFPAVAYEQT